MIKKPAIPIDVSSLSLQNADLALTQCNIGLAMFRFVQVGLIYRPVAAQIEVWLDLHRCRLLRLMSCECLPRRFDLYP